MNDCVQKKFPIGIDDFKKIIQEYYFVDKSGFIADILDFSNAEVSLITRPRRFGKTLMLSMLEYFFSIDQAIDNRKLFTDLKIERLGEKYMQRQGSAPVIFLSLKNIAEKNFDFFIEKFSLEIAKTYRKFSYILNSDAISKYYKDDFDKICAKKGSIVDLEQSIENLTAILNQYYQKKVIVLIDEYDAPIINAWNKNYYDDCIEFMRNFFGSCFKTNRSLDFAVLTGIMRISKESIFSGVNNFKVFSIFNDLFSDVFGFTEPEVAQFLNAYNIKNDIDELKEWYDGYTFGNSEVYNPWSIVNYIYEKYFFKSKPTTYWVNVSDNSIIHDFLQHTDSVIRHELYQLMSYNSIQKNIDESLIFTEIPTNTDALFSILVSTGYLKVIKKELHNGLWTSLLKIPNKEVYEAYKNEVYKKLPSSCKFNLNLMFYALTIGDETTFSEHFYAFLLVFVSSFDTKINAQEYFYHGLFLGLLSVLGESYIIESNKESGLGRFDICCIPKKDSLSGIILEFKSSKRKTYLNRDANSALKQITNLKYPSIFEQYSTESIWQYGIAFYRKNFVVKKNIIKP